MLKMSRNDRRNLTFLLSMGREECLVWFDTVSEEDQAYALGLIKLYSKEMKEREILLAVSNPDYKVYDLSKARKVLEKFKL